MRDLISIVSEGFADKIWYHGTRREFDHFSNAYTHGQLGTHLGSTVDQATWRLGDDPGFVLSVRANVKNLIRLRDEGSWYGEHFVEQLRQNPKTSHVKWRGGVSDSAIARELKALGYDGVIYANKFEKSWPDDAKPSIIVFDPSNLEIIGRADYDGSIIHSGTNTLKAPLVKQLF